VRARPFQDLRGAVYIRRYVLEIRPSRQAMKRSSRPDRDTTLRRARSFLSVNARLLERRRFQFLFEKGSSESVLLALNGYRNPDGGFGHGLEPDLRGPESEPVPVWTALGILDEIDCVRGPTLAGILRYVARAEVSGGGLPFVFPSASRSPHAPWWETGPGRVRGSLNPTAGIVAYLSKNRVRTRWLARASSWCWNRIDRLREANPYELRVVLAFLDWSPERRRAEAALDRLRPLILKPEVVELDPKKEGDAFRPLDLSPNPGLLSRSLFSPQAIEENLNRIVERQRKDGGWGVDFPIWTPITRFEWEGCQTIEMLKVLRANRRLDLS
jgi:hypothetical protein